MSIASPWMKPSWRMDSTFLQLQSTGKVRPRFITWWCHQMEPFSTLLDLCARNSPVAGEFPSQKSEPRGFEVFFDLSLNKRLSKQSRRQWFETPSRSLWRHYNENRKLASQRNVKKYTFLPSVSTAPADGLTLLGARTSACTVMTKRGSHMLATLATE